MSPGVRVVAFVSLLLSLAVAAAPMAGGPATLVAAHRGGAALWPENSLLAFRQALALGVDALEFDLHMTSDGELVVLHDPTLDRTTTGTGPVRDLKLADLAGVRLKTRDGAVTDERIPTFAQLLELAAAAVELLPEIKVDANRQRYDSIEDKVLALLRARGLLARSRRPARCSWWREGTSSAIARDRPRRSAGRATSERRTSG